MRTRFFIPGIYGTNPYYNYSSYYNSAYKTPGNAGATGTSLAPTTALAGGIMPTTTTANSALNPVNPGLLTNQSPPTANTPNGLSADGNQLGGATEWSEKYLESMLELYHIPLI